MISNLLIFAAVVAIGPVDEPNAHAAAIDSLLADRYASLGIDTADATTDNQFVRRLYLDLAGRIPSTDEVVAFTDDPDRNQLINTLLNSPDFSRFLSEAWTTWLVGYTSAFQTDRETFRVWLEDQIHRDISFKNIVKKILSAEGSTAVNGPANFLARHFDDPVPAVCRSFLGVRIECAQCHDHPFDRWSQDDYEHMRRFFEPMNRREQNGVVTIEDRQRLEMVENRPRFLTGAIPRTGRYRAELALYLTNCKPFARNFANRCWYFLMGQGIVDPPDDFNQENEAADEKLLEQMAQNSRDKDFSIREMFRTICQTKAYQRQTAHNNDQQALKLFAARKVKPLLPIQYIDSLWVALDREPDNVKRRQFIRQLVNTNDLNEDYQRLWEYRESVQQLMRNMTFQFKGHVGTMKDVTATQLFQRFWNRDPTDDELELCENVRKEDIMFALALGNEFCFNH